MKKTIYEEVFEAKQKRTEMREKLSKMLAKAKADKAAADKAAAEALNSGNVDAYRDANKASEEADGTIKFYQIQIKNLDSAPLFDDYTKKIAAIKADQQKKIDRINERAVKIMKELNSMIAEFYADFDETNKALEIAYTNTGFTYRATVPLQIKGIYQSTEAVKINPELSRYW